MKEAPRDGSTVIVLAEDFSCAGAFRWSDEANCWMQFNQDWTNRVETVVYTYDDDLDGYGWVPAP